MIAELRRRIGGHVWTVGRHLVDRAKPPPLPPGEAWRRELGEPGLALSGRLHRGRRSDVALILVHGLGGSADSGYIRRLAAAAIGREVTTLRINLRGADRSGDDIYHAGLTDDLVATASSPELAGADAIAIIGFSLGGHVALRFAATAAPARLAAVAAVCAPLDLAAGAAHIDHPRRSVYRRHLLRGLREIHAACVRRGRAPIPLSVDEARDIATIREWDDRIVAPRFGFAGAADYYARSSAGPALARLEVPGLLVRAPADPMVPPAVAEPGAASPTLQSWELVPGGHVGFPRRLGLEKRILDWIEAQI